MLRTLASHLPPTGVVQSSVLQLLPLERFAALPLHLLEPLDLMLEDDAHIMALAQRRIGLHDDLDLDEEARPKMICADLVECARGGMSLGHFTDKVEEVWIRRAADDQVDSRVTTATQVMSSIV